MYDGPSTALDNKDKDTVYLVDTEGKTTAREDIDTIAIRNRIGLIGMFTFAFELKPIDATFTLDETGLSVAEVFKETVATFVTKATGVAITLLDS